MWLPSSPYLPCGRTPGGPPVGACTARAPFGHGRVVRPAPSLRCLPTLPRCPRGGGPRSATVIPHPRGGGGVWGGGGRPCRFPFVAHMSQARRKHDASTGRGCSGGGGFPFGAPIPPRSGTSPASLAGPCRPGLPPYVAVLVPVFSLSSPGALVCFVLCFFFCVSTARRPSLPLARRSVLCPPPPMSPRRLLAVLAPFLGGWGRRGWGGGASSLSVLWRKHVASTAQARGAALVPLQGGGACRVAPVVALPTLRSHPRCPPRWGLHGACFLRARSCGPSRTLSPLPPHLAALSSGGGGGLVRPSLPSSPTLGGAEVCGGGGACRLPFVARMSQAQREHGAGTRRGTCPSAGGGGACLVAPVVALSTLRSHPRWSPGWGLHGACSLRARSCGPSRTLSPLPPHPAALSSGGGGACRPPLPASSTLGGAGCVWGGGGAHVVFPSLHACRRHDASTTQARGEALGCSGGGGGSLLGLPALLHGIGSAPQDLRPLSPLGGSRHVSAWCSVSRACSLLCPYLLEEVRTRVETDDEEVRAAGRTYRTPRRLLAPSAALVEGRAPVLAPNSPGGADCPSSPWCLCIHFRAA